MIIRTEHDTLAATAEATEPNVPGVSGLASSFEPMKSMSAGALRKRETHKNELSDGGRSHALRASASEQQRRVGTFGGGRTCYPRRRQ